MNCVWQQQCCLWLRWTEIKAITSLLVFYCFTQLYGEHCLLCIWDITPLKPTCIVAFEVTNKAMTFHFLPSFFFFFLVRKINRRFSDIPEAGRTAARLVIVWIWIFWVEEREKHRRPEDQQGRNFQNVDFSSDGAGTRKGQSFFFACKVSCNKSHVSIHCQYREVKYDSFQLNLSKRKFKHLFYVYVSIHPVCCSMN